MSERLVMILFLESEPSLYDSVAIIVVNQGANAKESMYAA